MSRQLPFHGVQPNEIKDRLSSDCGGRNGNLLLLSILPIPPPALEYCQVDGEGIDLGGSHSMTIRGQAGHHGAGGDISSQHSTRTNTVAAGYGSWFGIV